MRCDIYNGILSGLLAGVVFGIMMQMMNAPTPEGGADADDGNGRDGRALRQHCDPPSQARWTEFEPLVQCGANSH